jgi:hypothetical protein
MMMFRSGLVVACALLVLHASCFAQTPDSPAEGRDPGEQEQKVPATEEARRILRDTLAENGVRIDFEKRTVTIDAVVNRPDQFLEYLLIHPRGKAHEALLVSEAKPSLLNAAFLALGLEPGENARTEELDPQPTIEEIEAGAPWFRVIPPTGPEIWITGRWVDEESGETRELAIEDFLIDVSTGLWVQGNRWHYIGGRIDAPYRGDEPVFLADQQGNVISIPYMAPGNHLITMSHELCSDQENWWIAKKCPPPGHPIEVVFHTVKPDLVVEREERLRREREKAEREKAGESVDGGGQKDDASNGDGGETGGGDGG